MYLLKFGHPQLLMVISMAVMVMGCPAPPDDGGEDGIVFPTAPGLNVTIESVTIPADRRAEVVFRMTDDDGTRIPLDQLGSSDVRFALGAMAASSKSENSAQLVNYSTTTEEYDGDPTIGDGIARTTVQATQDGARTGGVTLNEDVDPYTYTYKFDTVLPEDYDTGAVHQLAGQIRWTSDFDGVQYVANPIFAFVPGFGEVDVPRAISTTATCNECHTRLGLHGGTRREIQLCIMCHNEQTVDANTGNSVNFPEMIHKIHRGADLPSVEGGEPYVIYGYRDTAHDYSDVEFPQNVSNCTKCHQDIQEAGGAPQADNWMTKPGLIACGSCHDRTWFDSGEPPEGFTAHLGGVQNNDAMCFVCHGATESGIAPIAKVHRARSLIGLDWDITDVATDLDSGEVSVTFTVDDAEGVPITDLATLDRIRAIITYPATDYTTRLYENPLGEDALLDVSGSATGTYVFTFEDTLPVDSTETFAIALSGRIEADPDGEPDSGDEYLQGPISNDVTYFTIDGGEPVPRRQIVSDESCSKCHGEVRMHHAPRRVGVEMCVMCHNPTMTGRIRNVEDLDMPQESKHFKRLVHEIHDAEVEFPGDVRKCAICHIDGTNELPISDDALPTMFADFVTIDNVEYELDDPDIEPARSACMACHTSTIANVHAILATDPMTGIETCVICHGEGSEFAVSKVHDIGP